MDRAGVGEKEDRAQQRVDIRRVGMSERRIERWSGGIPNDSLFGPYTLCVRPTTTAASTSSDVSIGHRTTRCSATAFNTFFDRWRDGNFLCLRLRFLSLEFLLLAAGCAASVLAME
eukprot:2213557-Rhodomonas_salina.2